MFYIPIGMVNGAPVSVGRYVWHSMIPSLIGNILGGILRESSTRTFRWWRHYMLYYIVAHTDQIVGVPMVLFYTPPELPLFRKRVASEVEHNHVDAVNVSGSAVKN
jgi:hypothetical protein